MIAGPQDDVIPISFDPGEGPEDLLAKYADAVDSSASGQYLILVDLLGAAPTTLPPASQRPVKTPTSLPA
nr:hypothetical protein [Actinomyces sp. 432]